MFIQPLPKITAPTAGAIVQQYQPSPAAAKLLQPNHTPAQYLGVLEQNHQSTDAINLLAHGMPERDATWWACQSARKVDNKLLPADKKALDAAEKWAKDPSPANQAKAAAAAAKTDYQGPGAWAAQAAASAKPAVAAPAAPALAAAVPGAPAIAAPAVPAVTPKAVAGSVQLSSALAAGKPLPKPPTMEPPKAPTLEMPKLPAAPPPPPPPTPAEQVATAKAHQPFIDLGKDVASGKNSCA